MLRCPGRSAHGSLRAFAMASFLLGSPVYAQEPLPTPADAPLSAPIVVPVLQPPTAVAPPPSNTGGVTPHALVAAPAVQGLSALPISAGRTPTTFSVSNSGAATYTIPIQTPPGVGPVQLKLALAYSSRGPNGLLGVGWSLTGLSAITRCNKTYAQDGNAGGITLQLSSTYSDRFCLDGKQLKLTSSSYTYGYSGSTYATEIESFSNIVTSGGQVGNGPASFTVTTKNGLIYEYGTTPDSQIKAGASGTIRTWALSKIKDRVGNYITLTYQNDTTNGSYRIDHILYPYTASGQGPYYDVLFAYGARPTNDVPSGYIAGYLVREPNQLNSITTEVYNGAVIKQYNLAYTQGTISNRNTLTTVQECSASTCLPTTTVAYTQGATGWQAGGSVPQPPGTTFPTRPQAMYGDFNGDGRTDILFAVVGAPGSGTLNWWVAWGTASGFSTPVSTGITTTSAQNAVLAGPFLGVGRDQILAAQGTQYYWDYNTATGTFTQGTMGGTLGTGIRLALDVDGDGLPDLLWEGASGSTNQLLIARNITTPGGAITFAPAVVVYSTTLALSFYIHPRAQIADFNGDGRADILVLLGSPTSGTWQALLSNGVNASGIVQAFTVAGSFPMEPDPQTLLFTALESTLLDWNGDGCTDFAQFYTLHVSDCHGGFVSYNWPAQVQASIGPRIAADWNGDGRVDLMYVGASVVSRR